MPLFRGTGGSGDASTDAYASQVATNAQTATTKANEASASAAAAATSATNAAGSEASVSADATTASNAASAAQTAQTASETAKTASETAQTASETAKTAAETAETNAAASATTATTKASEASSSATSATSSASSASTSATNAATSATAAQTAQTAAETAKTAAEAAQNAIDGLYLGAQSSNPTVDLNGSAITTGDWYFNTSDNSTRIYTGSAWDSINPNLVGDTSPQLGGNLDLNSRDITGTGNVGITGNITLSGTVDGRDVAADGTKLDGVEASATADQTAAEIRTLVESASDSNVFTDADHTKLNGIEASATADQTAAEIRTLVEAATDSNVFTDADHTKLNAIEASADVTDTANVTAAGALMDSEVTNLSQVKAFSSSDYATAAQGVKADSALQGNQTITLSGAVTGSGTTSIATTLSTIDGGTY